METIIKQLNYVGDELYRKYGTDSYQLRCILHDIVNHLSKLDEQKTICTYGDLCSGKSGYNNICQDNDTNCKYAELVIKTKNK